MELKAVPPVTLKLELTGTPSELLALAEAMIAKKRSAAQMETLHEFAATLRDLADPVGDGPMLGNVGTDIDNNADADD